uniref:Negative elongation factor E n=1 Tax=Setaria digitata TaxID=48799 RepID=A0A915PDZ6_9BILA
MKSVRDTGLVFPSTLSNDEKRLKEAFEKLRAIRKAIAATNKVNVTTTVGDSHKAGRKTSKRHMQQAEEATEEVKRKVLTGAVSFKKVDEKKDSFKRSSLVGRRRINNSNTESLSPNVDDGFDVYKPISMDDRSGIVKRIGESSDSFDTYKQANNDFIAYNNITANVSGTHKSSSSSMSQKMSAGWTFSEGFSNSKSPASKSFDAYKTIEEASMFDNYKPIGIGDSGDFDANTPSSSFDTYKPAIRDDGFDNYKPGSIQSFSFDSGSGSSPFGGFEQPKPCRGPCLYIRGYDLVADSLRNVFGKYGVINRIFVEERQKSAFITYATTEEAEVAIKEMDGNMVNGITLRVSFARRQNQCSDSGRLRSSKSFDKSNGGDERVSRDRSNRSRGERVGRFRGSERIRFRGEKSGRGRGRSLMYESEDALQLTVSAENNDDFWSNRNKLLSSEWQAVETHFYDKDDFSSTERQSPETTTNSGWSNIETDKDKDRKGDGFDTYKSMVSVKEKDDYNNRRSTTSDRKDDDGFDTYKLPDNGGNGGPSIWFRGAVGDNDHNNFEEKRYSEKRGGFSDDRYGSFRCDERDGRFFRRGNRNRKSPSWQSKKRTSDSRDDEYCPTNDLNTGQKSCCLASDESREKNECWAAGDHHCSNPFPENRLQEKDSDMDSFWPTPSHHSSDRGSECWLSCTQRSGGTQPFRGNRRGDRRCGRRGGVRGGGFRFQHRDFNDKSPGDEASKPSCSDTWPDVTNKPPPDSWTESCDKTLSSPLLPLMSEVQVAWSEATKKTSTEMAAAAETVVEATAVEREGPNIMQRKPEIRTQVSYNEDDPFA